MAICMAALGVGGKSLQPVRRFPNRCSTCTHPKSRKPGRGCQKLIDPFDIKIKISLSNFDCFWESLTGQSITDETILHLKLLNIIINNTPSYTEWSSQLLSRNVEKLHKLDTFDKFECLFTFPVVLFVKNGNDPRQKGNLKQLKQIYVK